MDTVNVLDHGYVKFIESWGSDRRIIESARQSTDKGFQGWGGDLEYYCPECGYVRDDNDVNRNVCPNTHVTDFTNSKYAAMLQSRKKTYHECKVNPVSSRVCQKGTGSCDVNHYVGDEKLLKYLWDHKHSTPFEFAGMIIEIQAPIAVFREWHRHRTQSYSEMSGRYTVLPNLYYVPSIERLISSKQSTTNKQSSEAGFDEDSAIALQKSFERTYEHARNQYDSLIAHGVAKEVARLVLPVAQYSRMRAAANLRNWLAFLTLRLDNTAQWEIRRYAQVVGTFISQQFPRTWELFSLSR